MTDTLQNAKDDLRKNWHNGTKCACCGQFVKVYQRKITSSQAVCLIKLVRLDIMKPGFHHVSDFGASSTGGEFAQLRRWGLIEEQTNDDTGKRCSGMWRPTDLGRDFAHNRVSVPRYVETYNNKTLGHSEDGTTILKALRDKFDYQELMYGEL